MFNLVADVARYPEFLPWVVATRIRSDNETEMVADMVAGFKSLRETFTSRVHKVRPSLISIDYIEGPLKFLHNEWRFDPSVGGGSLVGFSVDFAFKSRIFENLAGQVFDKALRTTAEAFEKRANELYGLDSRDASGISNSSARSTA